MVSFGTWVAIASTLYAFPTFYFYTAYTIATVTTWTAVACYKKLITDRVNEETGRDV